ncbi:ribbon-helix-helix protein, CopG family [Rhizobium sp. S-51]|uniref:Ribbon-helix-helix protein, CopG family n=1 Tax=Rhizobium terricola TaxID=2728849 RepID=A0A7Y0FX13_9HYPH|nr:DUF6290 family protein [Rhizobium terricola]NML75194.1 ribbon-helix-helix protein, CopG family [Rhizobium terricola]
MANVNIRIDDEIEVRWEKIAKAHGLDRNDMFREAIIEKLEELEDLYAAEARLKESFKPVPNDQVWKELGLAD